MNRLVCGPAIAGALAMLAANGSGAAVVLLNVTNLEQVRASHGSPGVDDAVRLGAKCVLSALRSTDAVGRVEDSAFMVAISPCASPEKATAVAELLCDPTLAPLPLAANGGSEGSDDA